MHYATVLYSRVSNSSASSSSTTVAVAVVVVAELSMGWVDPRVGLGWVGSGMGRKFVFLVGWVGSWV